MKRTYFHRNMVDLQLPEQWALSAFRLNVYFFASRSNSQSGVPPSFWTSPPNTRHALTNGPDPVRPAEEKVDLWNPAWQQQELNKAASGTIPGSNPFKSCPGSLRKGWSLFKLPLQQRDWRMRCQRRGTGKEGEEPVNEGTEGSLVLVSVTPLTASISGFDNQVKLQHVATKTYQHWERKDWN